jgi:hypothetical protein
MGKKKEIIEIKIDRLKLMRIPGRRRGSFMRPRKRRPSVSASRSISRRPGDRKPSVKTARESG